MKISTIIETPEGNYEYKAVLTHDQHAFLIEYAIKDLVQKGLVPFIKTEAGLIIPVPNPENKS